jgi:hypothetical protein
MSPLLSAPAAFIGFLNAKTVQTQARTTTWLVFGALVYQGLALLLTQRVALLLVFAVFFIQIIPTIFVSSGLLPNQELQTVENGKTTALFPKADGTKGSPSGRGIALLIIGIRISHPLGILAPGAKQTGDYFTQLVAELESNKAALGYLGGHYITMENGNSPSLIAYFNNMHDLHEFAQGSTHREAWNWWNKNVKNMPHLGVYHEAYDVPAHHWEAIYLQTPKMGLGAVEVPDQEGKLVSVIEDARKGVWRTSNGRLGRGEKRVSETDPYRHD